MISPLKIGTTLMRMRNFSLALPKKKSAIKRTISNQPLIPHTIFPGNRMLTVGILTVSNPKKESGLGGNLNFFRLIIIFIETWNIGVCIHRKCPSFRVDERVSFSSISNKWIECKVPFPDIVYNRIPWRSYEASEEFQHLITHFKDYRMTLFNPCFIDKYVMFEALTEDGSSPTTFRPPWSYGNSSCLDSFWRHTGIYTLSHAKEAKGRAFIPLSKMMMIPHCSIA